MATETIKEIEKFVKNLSPEQQQVLLKQLKGFYFQNETRRIDEANAIYQ